MTDPKRIAMAKFEAIEEAAELVENMEANASSDRVLEQLKEIQLSIVAAIRRRAALYYKKATEPDGNG